MAAFLMKTLRLTLLFSLCALSWLHSASPDPIVAARELDTLLANDWTKHNLAPQSARDR